MHLHLIGFLLVIKTIDTADLASTTKANQLLQSICETLQYHTDLHIVEDDHKWKILCEQYFDDKKSHRGLEQEQQLVSKKDIGEEKDLSNDAKQVSSRVSGSRISGIRITGSRTSGIRIPSGSQYRSTRTGATFLRPPGSLWSRSRLAFLAVSRRHFYRSRSSSNRYTTPAGSSSNYYYCTSDTDPSTEIQCTTTNNDNQCCEEEATGQISCCGGDVPDDFELDWSRATRTLAHLFYTIAALALCLHFFRRHVYRS